MTLLNCGYEKGEVFEMDGELVRVTGEDCERPYSDDPLWYPVVEPVEETHG